MLGDWQAKITPEAVEQYWHDGIVTPGDVVLLHPAVIHGGGHTKAGRRRRTLSVRFFGEDVVLSLIHI